MRRSPQIVWPLVLILASACADQSPDGAPDAAGGDGSPKADAAELDAGSSDAGLQDAGRDATDAWPDAGLADASLPDASDAGSADTGLVDAGPPSSPLDGMGTVELLRGGYQFTEGPVWDHANGVLLFSDIPATTIYRYTPPDGFDAFRPSSGGSNGLAFDPNGHLLAAEHDNRRVSITQSNGAVEDFAVDYMGDSLNSPNDLVVRSDGTVYFTDPPYGLGNRTREINFNGVFRKAVGASALSAEWEGPLSSRPNGIALSPDEQSLYVADTADGTISVFDVASDGATSGRRLFATTSGNPDGMAVDREGNLFVATASGIEAYAPDGTLWGTITVPQQPANCGFGRADGRSLFITAQTAVYEVRLAIPGLGF